MIQCHHMAFEQLIPLPMIECTGDGGLRNKKREIGVKSLIYDFLGELSKLSPELRVPIADAPVKGGAFRVIINQRLDPILLCPTPVERGRDSSGHRHGNVLPCSPILQLNLARQYG